MQENAKKLYFDAPILISVRVYAECIYILTEYLKYLSLRRHSYFSDKMWVALKRAGWLQRVLEVTSLCFDTGSES